MPEAKPPTSQIISFILGDLSPEEQEQFEAKCFQDAALQNELWSTFDDLVEQFLHNEMAPANAQKFAARLQASPFLLARVANQYEILQALKAFQPSKPTVIPSQPHTPFKLWGWPRFRWAMAIVFVMGLAGAGVWLFVPPKKNPVPVVVQGSLPPPTSPLSETVTATPAIKPTATPLPTPRLSQPSVLATFLLMRDAVREGSDAVPLRIPKSAKVAALQIEVRPPFFPQYQVLMETDSGKVFRSFNYLSPQKHSIGTFIQLRLPTRDLTSTTYTAKIMGLRAGTAPQTVDTRTLYIEKK